MGKMFGKLFVNSCRSVSLGMFFLLYCVLTKEIRSDNHMKVLLDFSNLDSSSQWMVVNDGVMGGVSKSNFRWHHEGYLIFEGQVSTDFGGGFASLRSGYKNWDIGNYEGIILKIRGDLKKYQFRCRLGDDLYQVAYRHHFQTKNYEWQEVRLAFSDFVPTYRGRVLKGLPSLNSRDIRSFGIMISDKQVGNFNLDLAWIGVF